MNMDSSLEDILNCLNRGENPSLSGLPSDDGFIRHGGLNKREIINMLAVDILVILVAVITMIAVLYPLKSTLRPNGDESHEGGKIVSAEELYQIGNQYYYGDGVEKDYVKARTYYNQAAEMGYADALNDLGVLYLYGYGVEQNFETARTYYERAAEKGNARAYYNLGLLYEHGLGVEPNLATAKQYYEQAVEKGDETASESLARIRENMNQP